MLLKDTIVLSVSGKINKEQYEKVLFELLSQRNKEIRKIILVICSEGGSISYAFAIYDLLKNEIDLTLIETNSNNFNRDLVVVPAYVSKGLEFDAVIIYTDKNNKYTLDEKYLYYVAITRTQHELIIYNN